MTNKDAQRGMTREHALASDHATKQSFESAGDNRYQEQITLPQLLNSQYINVSVCLRRVNTLVSTLTTIQLLL
jgi:hypothetical protein